MNAENWIAKYEELKKNAWSGIWAKRILSELAFLIQYSESLEGKYDSLLKEKTEKLYSYVKGNAGRHNGVSGDLLIQVEEEDHPDLIRQEDDLIYNLLLSFPTAALGGTVEIPTIDSKVKVKIEPGTQPGKVLRLRGKGLPSVNGYGRGDLLVNVSVYVPETLSKEEKHTLEKMDTSENFRPNMSVKEKIFKKFRNLFD